MYFKNGYVYGGTPADEIKVSSIRFLDNLMMLITFSSGETRLFDVTELKGEAFQPLQDPSILNQCIIENGIPTWCGGSIDCAPEYIYEHSYEYPADTYTA